MEEPGKAPGRAGCWRKVGKMVGWLVVALALAGAFVWWQWVYVPVPAYVPQDAAWKRVDKQTKHFLQMPCVYVRYEVDLAPGEAAEKLKGAIDGLGEWERHDEVSSEELLAEVQKKWRDTGAGVTPFVNRRVAPAGGGRYAVATDQPYRVLHWFRHETPATHRYVTVRVIEKEAGGCTVELWDFRLFDH